MGKIWSFHNQDNFGKLIALNSDGFRIAIAADKVTYLYDYINGVWTYMDLKLPSQGVESDISSVSFNSAGDVLCIGQRNYPNEENVVAGRCVCYKIQTSSDGVYTVVMIGQPLFGNEPSEHYGSVVELSKDGNILAITSLGLHDVLRLYYLSSSPDLQTHQWKQIEPNIKPKDPSESSFGSSVSMSIDGSSIYVGSPTGVDNYFGTTFVYGVDTLNEAELTS